jgi:hypothetical protein
VYLKQISIALLVLLFAAHLVAKPSPTASDCIFPIWTPTTSVQTGPNAIVCETYFLGIMVNRSSVPCQASTTTTPGHYTCDSSPSATKDCIGGANHIIQVFQAYKGECEGNTGLNIEVGGVTIGIDWWKAVCKADGPPINSVMVTDAAIGCPSQY